MKKKLYLLISVMTFGCTTIFAQQTDVTMPNMIPVEGGTFMMGNNAGSKDEKPVHKVTLNSFFIGEYEVTLKDFRKFVNATGYKTDAEQPDTFRRKHGLPPRGINNGSWKMNVNNSPVPTTDSMNPVGNISWNDAMEYCKWLSKSTGKTFRLPTEAEWEFAARGGLKSKNFKYAGGNILDDVAWVGKNSNSRSHTVGKKMANELGIYDMAGNVRLRYCLFAIEEDDVKGLLRGGASDQEIAALVRRNVSGKWIGHEINSGKFVAPSRPMYQIGG